MTETVTDAGGLSSTKTASVTVTAPPSCGGTVLCSGVGVALPSVATGGVSSNYTMTDRGRQDGDLHHLRRHR